MIAILRRRARPDYPTIARLEDELLDGPARRRALRAHGVHGATRRQAAAVRAYLRSREARS